MTPVSIHLKHKTVLIIDDDQDEHLFIREAIAGEETASAFEFYQSAKLALEHLEQGMLLPDLIVVDINMPIMTGLEFLAALRQRPALRHLPVLVHSTTSDPSTRQTCQRLGALAFIKKAMNHRVLMDAIRQVLDTEVSR